MEESLDRETVCVIREEYLLQFTGLVERNISWPGLLGCKLC